MEEEPRGRGTGGITVGLRVRLEPLARRPLDRACLSLMLEWHRSGQPLICWPTPASSLRPPTVGRRCVEMASWFTVGTFQNSPLIFSQP